VKNNKLIVIFLIKFFGTYALLFFLYSSFLNKTQEIGVEYTCDPITGVVANQTAYLLNKVGYDAGVFQHPDEVSMVLGINNVNIARVIEGCNSISVIILFISFIVAFSGNFIITALYILFGSLIIYTVNILRIVIISIAMYEYPEYQESLHTIVFPTIIYGITFILWFVWVNQFTKFKK